MQANNGITWYTPTPLDLKKSFQSFIYIDAEEREKEENQNNIDFYLSDLQEESDLMYTKPQDKQIKVN